MSKFGYRPKHFQLHELVGPELFKEYGQSNPEYLWRLLDECVLEALDIIKEYYKMASVTVNNYGFGGKRKESFLRDPFTKTGAKLSAHKFGRAADFLVDGVDAETVKADIKNKRLPARFYELINCVEANTNGWNHIARLNYVTNGIVWVNG